MDGDEEDGFDEAILPFDARKTFVKGVYEGKNHLIDDELYGYLARIRKKIGKYGSLLVVTDACHSEDATRRDRSIVCKIIVYTANYCPAKKNES